MKSKTGNNNLTGTHAFKGIAALIAVAIMALFTISNQAKALSSPYLSLGCEEDVVTNDGALLHANLKNIEGNTVKAFELAVVRGDTEVIRYQKTVNSKERTIKVVFDTKKDTKVKLDAGEEYQYSISAIIPDSKVNSSMYTNGHHFITPTVQVSLKNNVVKKDNAVFDVQLSNPKEENIMQVGIKIFSGDKLLKECIKNVNKKDKQSDITFDIKSDAKYTLKQGTNYRYIIYAKVDVSHDFLYSAISECEGIFKTLSSPGVTTSVTKAKKTITFNNRISNPDKKKIGTLKVVVKSGKKQQVVYKKKLSAKNQTKIDQTVKVKIKKSKIKKNSKNKTYTFITYVKIGNKTYRSKGKFKL
ncbi:MAG: hypothetical protein K6G65_00540 [Lachnospiraceae bacterium]|nr:hypothetical protein [Lachnospiraceae bacterium]